jgi:hypothetical protein
MMMAVFKFVAMTLSLEINMGESLAAAA